MIEDIVYANDLGCAFLASIVEAFSAIHSTNHSLGRATIQKLTYFLKVAGVPVPFRFGIYTYGPYSDDITFAVESLLADDVIEDRSKTREYSNYRPGPNSRELLAKFGDELENYEGKISSVVKTLGKFSHNELEVISTLHFIAIRQMRLGRDVTRESLIKEFRSIKGEKFRESDIRTYYQALDEAGLIAKPHFRVSRA